MYYHYESLDLIKNLILCQNRRPKSIFFKDNHQKLYYFSEKKLKGERKLNNILTLNEEEGNKNKIKQLINKKV